MYKKYFYVIPLFLLEVIIQLGFFWLAPECECKWVVYSFLTVMTVIHLVITFLLIVKHGVRKATATIVAGSLIQVIIIGTAIALLTVSVSLRSALFLMLMLMALYAAIVTVLWISIEGFRDDHVDGRNGSYSEEQSNMPAAESNDNLINDRNRRIICDSSERVPIQRRTAPPVPIRR